MAQDRLERIEKILANVVREQELFAIGMRQLQAAQEKTTKEVDKLSKEIDKLSKEVDRLGKEVDKVNKMVGELTGGWGKFVVGLVEPSIEECIEDIGFKLIRAQTPPPIRKADKELEIDILAVIAQNSKPYIMVIDVKSYINHQKIDDFINKRLVQFKEFFIDYKGLPLIGAVAGVRYAPGTENKILRQGLYLFKTSKGFMRNATPPKFKPKIW